MAHKVSHITLRHDGSKTSTFSRRHNQGIKDLETKDLEMKIMDALKVEEDKPKR